MPKPTHNPAHRLRLNDHLPLLLAVACSLAAVAIGAAAAPAATISRVLLLLVHPAFAVSSVPMQMLANISATQDVVSAQWTIAYAVAVVCLLMRDSTWFWGAALIVAAMCEVALLLALTRITCVGVPHPGALISVHTFAVAPALAATLLTLDALSFPRSPQ